MATMFNGCQSLERLDLSAFVFSNVKNILWMFLHCPSLEEVIFPESILQVLDVMRETKEMAPAPSPHARWAYGNAPIPEYELEMQEVTVRRSITFGEATDGERRKQLGLGPHTKITIVKQRKPGK